MIDAEDLDVLRIVVTTRPLPAATELMTYLAPKLLTCAVSALPSIETSTQVMQLMERARPGQTLYPTVVTRTSGNLSNPDVPRWHVLLNEPCFRATAIVNVQLDSEPTPLQLDLVIDPRPDCAVAAATFAQTVAGRKVAIVANSEAVVAVFEGVSAEPSGRVRLHQAGSQEEAQLAAALLRFSSTPRTFTVIQDAP